MNDNDRVRLQHIIENAQEALEFASGKTRSTLDSDKMLVKAITMNIAIIGEAAGKISKEFQQANPDIPWAAITGMRHVLIHNYFEIDLDELWSTVENDLPALIRQLQAVMPAENESE
jgi:uncharacterized protein with HEPN domain